MTRPVDQKIRFAIEDTRFADKISRREIALQSLESELPNIPGGETRFAHRPRPRIVVVFERQRRVR
jgi:hypothetical protein